MLFSGYLEIDSTGHAYRAGASDVIAKPIRPGRLLAAVRLALGRRKRASSRTIDERPVHRGADSISKRWARMALLACHAEDDPKTEPDVADAAAVSTSVFRRDCHECNVEPIDARDLIRLLRANGPAKRVSSVATLPILSGTARITTTCYGSSGKSDVGCDVFCYGECGPTVREHARISKEMRV